MLVYLAIQLLHTLEVVEIIQTEVNIASCIEHDGERPDRANYQAVGLSRDPKCYPTPNAAYEEAYCHIKLHDIEILVLAVARKGLSRCILGRIQIRRFGFSHHDSVQSHDEVEREHEQNRESCKAHVANLKVFGLKLDLSICGGAFNLNLDAEL